MFNSLSVVGHLAADPEMRYTPKGSTVTTFTMYNNYKYGEGKEDVTIFKCVFFGKQAERANQFLHKGDLTAVSGRLRLVTFQTREGTDKTYAEIVGSEFRSLASKPKPVQSYDDLQSDADEAGALVDEVDDLPF